MSITFGSVGDIISVCMIVKDLVNALDKSRGASEEYREVIRELWVLDRALLEVELLSRTHENTVELNALCETARRTVENCRRSVEVFTKRIKKYERSLGEGSSSGVVTGIAMKIRWQIGEKDEVSKFRAEIAAHSSAMNMLLATANVKLMRLNDESLKSRLKDAEQRAQSSYDTHDALLVEVRDRLAENNRLVSAGNAVAAKLAETFRLQWLRQLGSELKMLMRRIITINLATYQAVVAIQSGFPTRLERGLIQEPFILEDAIGRIAPVHLQFIGSWDAFDAVLEIRFRGVQGYHKVKRKEYSLQERATRREIDRSRQWETSFLPGQRVDMSLVFKDEVASAQAPSKVSCPRCQLLSEKPQNSDIQCAGCGMWYRRIEEIHDVEPPRPKPVPTPWKTKVQFGQSSFSQSACSEVVFGPSLPKKRQNDDDDDDGGDVIPFKRVRLISRRERIKWRTDDLFGFKNEAAAVFPVLTEVGDLEKLSGSRPWARPETLPRDLSGQGSTGLISGAVFIPWQDQMKSKRLEEELDRMPAERQSVNMCSQGMQRALDGKEPPGYYPIRGFLETVLKEKVSLTTQTRKELFSGKYLNGGFPSPPKRDASSAKASEWGLNPKYNFTNWDSNQEPFQVFRHIFDADSLGKWIYDWVDFFIGKETTSGALAGDLWWFLTRLAHGINLCRGRIESITKRKDMTLVRKHLDEVGLIKSRFKRLVRVCEDSANETLNVGLGNGRSFEFINMMFGRDGKLEETVHITAQIRRWVSAFEAECETILATLPDANTIIPRRWSDLSKIRRLSKTFANSANDDSDKWSTFAVVNGD